MPLWPRWAPPAFPCSPSAGRGRCVLAARSPGPAKSRGAKLGPRWGRAGAEFAAHNAGTPAPNERPCPAPQALQWGTVSRDPWGQMRPWGQEWDWGHSAPPPPTLPGEPLHLHLPPPPPLPALPTPAGGETEARCDRAGTRPGTVTSAPWGHRSSAVGARGCSSTGGRRVGGRRGGDDCTPCPPAPGLRGGGVGEQQHGPPRRPPRFSRKRCGEVNSAAQNIAVRSAALPHVAPPHGTARHRGHLGTATRGPAAPPGAGRGRERPHGDTASRGDGRGWGRGGTRASLQRSPGT